jgi:carbon monoxide dehydrogenase subunit G
MSWFWNLPAAQRSHAVFAPADALYLPAWQLLHDAPVVARYLPASQSVHATLGDLVEANLPLGHVSQPVFTPSAALYVPAPQLSHAVFAPADALYVPAWQLLHDAPVVARYLPASQSVHATVASLAVAYWPFGHVSHFVFAPANALYLPASQLTHTSLYKPDAPATLKVPAAQLVQDPAAEAL